MTICHHEETLKMLYFLLSHQIWSKKGAKNKTKKEEKLECPIQDDIPTFLLSL